MTTPEQLITTARGWIGAPYLHQGRGRHGVDCLGLVLEVARAHDLIPGDLDWRGYGRMPFRSFLEKEIATRCTQIEAAVPGSLVVIKWSRAAAHLAICTGPNLIHACASRKQVVEHGYRGVWLRLTHSVWALPGVAYE